MHDQSRYNLFGNSAQFQKAQSRIEKIAKADVAVLIAGETGTGKEMAARAIHYLGARNGGPFIPVNCGALPEALIESELFGHERGAFTDAKSASTGLISEADGGTLFLDEVDALSHKAQAALLRFLQDHTFRRVGSSVSRQADVRIIVASNANLDELVFQRRFRRDLLYRLNVLTLSMPALRDREGDAVELASLFLKRFCKQYRTGEKHFHPASIHFITQHSWPGNVRELENLVHREFLMSESDEILFETAIPQDEEEVLVFEADFKRAKAHAIAQFEHKYLKAVLERSEGNLSHAARLAGQERSAFGKLARKHGFKAAAPLATEANE